MSLTSVNLLNPSLGLHLHQGLENLKVLYSCNLDILLRSRHDVHLSATQLSHQRTRCHRVVDALGLSLLVRSYQVAQPESLRRLRTDQLVARNTCRCRKPVLTLQDSLTTLDASNRITILLADGDVGRDNILREQRPHGIMYQHKVIVAASSLFQTIDTIVYRLLPIGSTRENPSLFSCFSSVCFCIVFTPLFINPYSRRSCPLLS